MIKALYDHQKFSTQLYGGISRYFANLIAGVNASPGFEAGVSMVYNKNHYLSNLKFPLHNAAGKLIFGSKPSRIEKWNKQYSRYRIQNNNFDLLHPTYYHPYFLKGLKKPYVLTVHDMIYELLPEHFVPEEQVMAHKKVVVEKASAIIAISQSTKRDLMMVLNVPPSRIHVIPHGIAPGFDTEVMAGLPASYLLFVGERANYKNFSALLHCFEALRNNYPGLHLVCTGGGAFSPDELELQKKLNLKSFCMQINASDAQLNYLYQQAQVFVFPSLYEGFGYPVLEAFRAGCAIVTSSGSSFTEVGGDAINYFDTHDHDSMYKAIDGLLSNQELKKAFIEKGYERLKLFSLQQEIYSTLDVYREIVT